MSDELLQKFQGRMMPFGNYLGIKLTEVTPDVIRAVVPMREELSTHPGIMHGGALMGIADNLGAIGTVVNLEQGKSTTTIESKTNFLSGLPQDQTAHAVSIPLHKGRTTHVWQTTISRDDGKVCAIITQTQLVLERR
jgi:1,4-dihydroxy-2-naphthoyl-CoA hydrolase